MRSTVLAVSLFYVGLTGCASIVSGVSQPISLEAKLNGEPVVGATCKLSSNKGTWFVTSPGSLTVHRGFQDMLVECAKPGMNSSTDNVASNVRALYFGNILFGGVIGLAVDAGNGAGFDYPDLISIDMGRNAVGAVPSAAVETPITSASPVVVQTTSASPGVAQTASAPKLPVTTAPAPVPAKMVAVAPVAAPTVATTVVANAPTKTSYKYMIAAETYVREQGACSAKPRATLAASGPGYETYAIACDSGESLIARCDFGHCHSLR